MTVVRSFFGGGVRFFTRASLAEIQRGNARSRPPPRRDRAVEVAFAERAHRLVRGVERRDDRATRLSGGQVSDEKEPGNRVLVTIPKDGHGAVEVDADRLEEVLGSRATEREDHVVEGLEPGLSVPLLREADAGAAPVAFDTGHVRASKHENPALLFERFERRAIDVVHAREGKAASREDDAASLLREVLGVLRSRIAAAHDEDVHIPERHGRDVERDPRLERRGNRPVGLAGAAEDADRDRTGLRAVREGGRLDEEEAVAGANRAHGLPVVHGEAVVLDRAVEIGQRLALARIREAEDSRADGREALVVRRDELRVGVELADGEGVRFSSLQDEEARGRDSRRDGFSSERDARRPGADDDEVEKAGVFVHRLSSGGRSRATVAPQPPLSGVASENDATKGDRASAFLTIVRWTPIPRP